MRAFARTLRSTLCALALACAAPAVAQEAPPQIGDAVDRFLGQDCADEAIRARLVEALRGDAQAAEASFIRLIEIGPGPRLLELERAEIRSLHAQRQSFLRENSSRIDYVGFDPEAETEEDFLRTRLRLFRLRLASRSLEGLAALGTESALRYLRVKAQDEAFELREEAAELLR